MMIQGAPVVLGGKKKSNVPAFVYTGKYNVRDDDVVELLESGDITFVEDGVIDVFMVGGGGGGKSSSGSSDQGYGYAGGAGGYTRTVRRINVAANTNIPVTIGAGGATSDNGEPGGASGFNTFSVSGAERIPSTGYTQAATTKGGSGGGGGVRSNSDYGAGGTDGNNGESGYPINSSAGGNGQGFSTREFNESTGKLYAAGGGGGRYISAQTPVISPGGTGGGGSGAWSGSSTSSYQVAAAGVANTGSGGGGGATPGGTVSYALGASGGSGIVCFRAAQELPELAGTWVLNERLYASEAHVNAIKMKYTCKYKGGETTDCTQINDTGNYVIFNKGGSEITKYTFSTNTWTRGAPTITIIDPGTANDEFRAWLASNATKQS